MQLFPPDAFEYVGTLATLPIWKFTVGSPNSTKLSTYIFRILLIACHSHHIDDMKRIIYFIN